MGDMGWPSWFWSDRCYPWGNDASSKGFDSQDEIGDGRGFPYRQMAPPPTKTAKTEAMMGSDRWQDGWAVRSKGGRIVSMHRLKNEAQRIAHIRRIRKAAHG